MNAYVQINGKKYATLQRSWVPSYNPPMTLRMCQDGTIDVTHGPKIWYAWQGELKIPVTPGTGYGLLTDITSVIEGMTTVTFYDHRNVQYSVTVSGQIPEKSATPMWDAASNELWLTVKIMGIKAAV